MFTKYEDGAEIDIGTVARFDKVAGVEVEAEGVYKFNTTDGVEEQVWGGYLKAYATLENSQSITLGIDIDKTNFSTTFEFTTDATDYSMYLWIETEEGEFINPVVSFDYSAYEVCINTGMYDQMEPVYVCGIDEDGSDDSGYWNMTGYIGNGGMPEDGGSGGSGSVEKTITGTHKKIAIRFYPRLYVSNTRHYMASLTISNLMIDGQKYLIT